MLPKFVPDVIQGDDGRYRLGIHDDGPGFETRPFAASVLAETNNVAAHNAAAGVAVIAWACPFRAT